MDRRKLYMGSITNKVKDDEKVSFPNINLVSIICVSLGLIVLFLFLLHREYDTELPFDTSFFGTYGDFVGGVIGTIIAFYSVYLLILTFQNQVKVNKNVIDTNDSVVKANYSAINSSNFQAYQSQLQLFDNKFSSFMRCYLQAVEAYRNVNNKGRDAFEEIAEEFINTNFENHSSYNIRNNSATSEYENFYSRHRVYMSVHFRMLYLLVSFISDSDLDDDDKVIYAKLVRGQLSDMEVLILRYNCRSVWGRKMQDYCNQFNLLKHLPVMQLLELKRYYKILKEKAEQRNLDFNELLEGLNSMFYMLQKYAKDILIYETDKNEIFNISKRYHIKMSSKANGKRFYIKIIKNKTASRRGGGKRLTFIEKALDVFEQDDLSELFRDFFCELFNVSNFGKYNAGMNVIKGVVKDNTDEYICQICISNSKHLALSVQQVDERDKTQTIDIEDEQYGDISE